MQKSTANQSQYLLQSVDNALRLLNLFSGEDRLSLTEIAARMGCGKTIAYRLAYKMCIRDRLYGPPAGRR